MRPEAEGDEGDNRLAAFGKACRVVKALFALCFGGEAPFGGKGCKAQEAHRGQHKACDKDERGPEVLRCGSGKAQRHGDVENIVADDVEIAAEIGCRRLACDRPVEAVEDTVEKDEGEACAEVPAREGKARCDTDGGTGERYGVGVHTAGHQEARGGIERRVDEGAQMTVEHGGRLSRRKRPCKRT